MRETSSISSGTDSPEYKLIQRLTPELRTAIQDDLHDISDHLLSCGMITQESHEDFTNFCKSTHVRAASLIRAVQNKIKSDRHYYSDFIKVLEKNKQFYDSILKKIYSHNMDSSPMYSQYHKYEDNSDESDEAGALLHRVPYVQYEDESCRKQGQLRHSLSNTVSVCLSSCIDTVICLVEIALHKPPITICVQLIIYVLLIILLVQLVSNVTTVYGVLFVCFLFSALLTSLACFIPLVFYCVCIYCCEDD